VGKGEGGRGKREGVRKEYRHARMTHSPGTMTLTRSDVEEEEEEEEKELGGFFASWVG
jgi:hypothetical protein